MTRLLKPATLIPVIAGFLLGVVLSAAKDYVTASGRQDIGRRWSAQSPVNFIYFRRWYSR